MKLINLNPCFVSQGGAGITNAKTGEPVPEQKGVSIGFDCPCGKCGQRAYLPFANPISGGEYSAGGHPTWQRTGETFETLTLRPSIQRMGGCGWHGHLINGEFKSC